MTSQPARARSTRRATRRQNEGYADGFAACFSDPCLYHVGLEDRSLTREEHADAVRSYLAVFPDFHGSIETLLVGEDRAFVRWSYTGTHVGRSPSGVEPTGKRIDVGTVFAEARIEDGLIVEVWELSSFVDLNDIAALNESTVPRASMR